MNRDSTAGVGIDLLMQTGSLLVLNKPTGLPTQAPPEIESVESRVRHWLRDGGDRSPRPYVGIPHRLDRPASGAIVVGLDKPATRALARQFELRAVEKTYWALVQGVVEPAHGRWTDYMRKLPTEARSEIVDAKHPDAQLAVLSYRVLSPLKAGCLLEISLETGRTHQIRLQSGHRGHPIRGDDLYGSRQTFGPPVSDVRLRPIALHARRLSFDDPHGGARIQIEAPVPLSWRALDEEQNFFAD